MAETKSEPEHPFGTDSVGLTLEQRQASHGDAWLIIGQYLSTMYKQGLLNKVFDTPYCYAWVMEFAKLIRSTQRPMFVDNWHDMQGYARLVEGNLPIEPTK